VAASEQLGAAPCSPSIRQTGACTPAARAAHPAASTGSPSPDQLVGAAAALCAWRAPAVVGQAPHVQTRRRTVPRSKQTSHPRTRMHARTAHACLVRGAVVARRAPAASKRCARGECRCRWPDRAAAGGLAPGCRCHGRGSARQHVCLCQALRRSGELVLPDGTTVCSRPIDTPQARLGCEIGSRRPMRQVAVHGLARAGSMLTHLRWNNTRGLCSEPIVRRLRTAPAPAGLLDTA
jgi:hypothetical protein